MAWLWGIVGFVLGVALATALAFLTRHKLRKREAVFQLLKTHFVKTPLGSLRVATRNFPVRMRADVQRALDEMFTGELTYSLLTGVRLQHETFEGISLSTLLTGMMEASQIPVHYEEVNIGEDRPARVQDNSLWLAAMARSKGAILLSRVRSYGGPGSIRIDIAAPNDDAGDALIQHVFAKIEEAVRLAPSYRGKVLSMENTEDYSGEGTGLTVHAIPLTTREQVILPDETLALLDRNVIHFVRRRERLGEFGQSKKKGLLLYGPPGVGKTHTIRYLATSLPGQTTLLMTAEQMGYLSEYMSLARLLQPSIVVIEDVDLIARARGTHDGPCTEALLNKLLNEMDGLKEDAEILFILTTNRPHDLEEALAARPGRIDQSIEFDYPDAEGRRRLVRLYAREARVSQAAEDLMVQETDEVGGAFIKELVRRALLFHLERADDNAIDEIDVEKAVEELLHHGGEINVRSLGAPFGFATRQRSLTELKARPDDARPRRGK